MEKQRKTPLTPDEKRKKRRESSRKYYEKHKVRICKALLERYVEHALKRIQAEHGDKLAELYERYPYEEFGEKLIKRCLRQLRIAEGSYAYQECYDAGMMAYLYTVHRCAVIEMRVFKAYANKVMRIYMNCTLVVCDDSRNLCRENRFRQVKLDAPRIHSI